MKRKKLLLFVFSLVLFFEEGEQLPYFQNVNCASHLIDKMYRVLLLCLTTQPYGL